MFKYQKIHGYMEKDFDIADASLLLKKWKNISDRKEKELKKIL